MASQLTRAVARDPLIADEVPYAVLTPDRWTADERLPLILLLHGANSSRDTLATLQPIIDGMWGDGSLPRSVVACATTPVTGGCYIDHGEGRQWESFIATAFPRLLEKEYGTDPASIALMGSSMGGYGGLKIAFADPERWLAVAAIAPALLPAKTREELRPRNTVSVLAELGDEMAANGYQENSVLHRLRANADVLRASELPILLRCGDRDVLNMHDGTEQLHRALWDLDIGHEYHLVFDADHIGPQALDAQRAALAFIGTALRVGSEEPASDRELAAAWHAWATGGRKGTPPNMDAYGSTGPLAMRLQLEPELADAALSDPTMARRYGHV